MKRSLKQSDLSIVIPALNEEKRIGKTLIELAQYLQNDYWRGKNVEVIVVSADSIDQTHAVVESHATAFKNFKLLKPGPKVGKGRDVRYGMLRAQGRHVLFMDADLATPLHHIGSVFEKAESGADVVIGVRNLGKVHKSLPRHLVSNMGNILFKVLGGIWIEDSQCGFKLFTAHANKLCFEKLTIEKWGFDMELLAIAKANKLQIATHRIQDWTDMPGGTFDSKVIKNALVSFRDLLLISWRRLSGQYSD